MKMSTDIQNTESKIKTNTKTDESCEEIPLC